jgi:hypothetical protein
MWTKKVVSVSVPVLAEGIEGIEVRCSSRLEMCGAVDRRVREGMRGKIEYKLDTCVAPPAPHCQVSKKVLRQNNIRLLSLCWS